MGLSLAELGFHLQLLIGLHNFFFTAVRGAQNAEPSGPIPTPILPDAISV